MAEKEQRKEWGVCLLKAESNGFAGGLGVKCNSRADGDSSRDFGPQQLEGGVTTVFVKVITSF